MGENLYKSIHSRCFGSSAVRLEYVSATKVNRQQGVDSQADDHRLDCIGVYATRRCRRRRNEMNVAAKPTKNAIPM